MVPFVGPAKAGSKIVTETEPNLSNGQLPFVGRDFPPFFFFFFFLKKKKDPSYKFTGVRPQSLRRSTPYSSPRQTVLWGYGDDE